MIRTAISPRFAIRTFGFTWLAILSGLREGVNLTTAADLRRALTTAGLDAPVDWQEVTGSTNATALEMAKAAAPEWSLAAAAHQTQGRGRRGRRWEDEGGRALMFSLVLRPILMPADAGLLSLLAGAVMAQAATASSPLTVRCKWPNDLLAEDGKVGGILAESAVEEGSLHFVVLGIGVNLEAPAQVEGAAGLGAGMEPMALLTTFLSSFREAYRTQDAAFADEVVSRWTAVADTIGRRVEATAKDGRRIAGVATGVDRRGGLVVRTPGGAVTVSTGEIVHLR
jgi:BirA family transcriptional regulator, biotin operon repressor / biotin---[acetyl-CoA-carboxylase] ligase